MLQKTSSTTICVFTKSGHSRRVAEYLGNHLGVAPFEITTNRYAWPIIGWIAAARDGMLGKAVSPKEPLKFPLGGTVVLVGPVWAGGPAAPLNAVVDSLAKGQQEVAAVLTCGDPKEQTTPLEKISKRLGRPLKAKMIISNGVQHTPEGQNRLEAFARALESPALTK